MSSSSDYVCTLDQASIKKAKDELNENPEDRLAAVQALREWIESQPHIRFPEIDTRTLLRYLRGCKFSQLQAREKLENYLNMKAENPKYFCDIDLFHPSVKQITELGLIIPLPKRTPDGCQLMLYRLGQLQKALESFNVTLVEIVRYSNTYMPKLLADEMTQVNGFKYIVDFTNVGPSLITKMISSESGKVTKMFQKGTVGRFKAFYYYRPGIFLETMITFYKQVLPKKWVERIKVHDTMESLYRDVPMECLPIEFLPDNYTGPNVGHIEDCIKSFSASLVTEEYRSRLLYRSSDAFGIDKSKKPAVQVTEHFRNLNVE